MAPLSPSDREYTGRSTTNQTLSRLDLAFASPALLRRVVSAEILSRGISDHAPLYVIIQLSPVEGRRMWRLSKYCIMDPEIQEFLPEALCNFWLWNAESTSPLMVWDAFKSMLRGGIHCSDSSEEMEVYAVSEAIRRTGTTEGGHLCRISRLG